MKKLFILLFFPLVLFSTSIYSGSSPKRFANERFQQAYNRIKSALPKSQLKRVLSKETPAGEKRPVEELDLSQTVEVATYEELMHMFDRIRDTRFLHAENDEQFERRISWLYPDDGCFARAAMAGIRLEEDKLTRPFKVYAFGDLMVTTPYSSDGSVSWWYHVAPVVKYMGVGYVLDPALNANKPMTLDEWFSSMGDPKDIKGSICNSYSYDPFDSCSKATPDSDDRALSDQLAYLDLEWDRIKDLGFDPSVLLGNNPPWIPETQFH